MKRNAKLRALCFFLSLLFLLGVWCPTAFAEAPPAPDTGAAQGVYFYHVESNSAVLTRNEDALLPAASTVKVLSGLLFCEALGTRLQETVVITREMVSGVTGRTLGLAEGDPLRTEELLYAAICGSYNDAYKALACHTSGNVESFVARMNARAKELGAQKSVFTDPIGTADTSLTTPKELALIARAAYENSLYMQICGTARYTISSLGKPITNRNEMIAATTTNKHYNSKCNGMSAGGTAQGGDCVVASATNGKESYLCIILGCKESEDAASNLAYILANGLIEWVYRAYTYMEIITPETVICTVPVTVSDMTTEIEIKTDQSLSYYLPLSVDPEKDLVYSIRLTQTSLEAPVEENTFVGYVAILYNGELIGTLPLYTAASAERSSFVSSLKAIQDATRDRKFVAGAIFFAVTLVGWITTEAILTRRRRHRWDKYFSNKIDTTKRMK